MPADDTTYRLRVFGSYRLDVHLPGADMDTLIVVVRQIDRKDMFTHLYDLLQSRPDISKLVKVEETRVPIIKVRPHSACFPAPQREAQRGSH